MPSWITNQEKTQQDENFDKKSSQLETLTVFPDYDRVYLDGPSFLDDPSIFVNLFN